MQREEAIARLKAAGLTNKCMSLVVEGLEGDDSYQAIQRVMSSIRLTHGAANPDSIRQALAHESFRGTRFLRERDNGNKQWTIATDLGGYAAVFVGKEREAIRKKLAGFLRAVHLAHWPGAGGSGAMDHRIMAAIVEQAVYSSSLQFNCGYRRLAEHAYSGPKEVGSTVQRLVDRGLIAVERHETLGTTFTIPDDLPHRLTYSKAVNDLSHKQGISSPQWAMGDGNHFPTSSKLLDSYNVVIPFNPIDELKAYYMWGSGSVPADPSWGSGSPIYATNEDSTDNSLGYKHYRLIPPVFHPIVKNEGKRPSYHLWTIIKLLKGCGPKVLADITGKHRKTIARELKALVGLRLVKTSGGHYTVNLTSHDLLRIAQAHGAIDAMGNQIVRHRQEADKKPTADQLQAKAERDQAHKAAVLVDLASTSAAAPTDEEIVESVKPEDNNEDWRDALSEFVAGPARVEAHPTITKSIIDQPLADKTADDCQLADEPIVDDSGSNYNPHDLAEWHEDLEGLGMTF